MDVATKKPTRLSPTMERLVPQALPHRTAIIREANELIARGDIERTVEAIIPPDASHTHVRLEELLALQAKLRSPAEGLATAQAIEHVIEARWAAGAHEMHCDIDLESLKEAFADAREVRYEFMPTKVDRDVSPGGLAKLLIGFPRGATEQDRLHTHPGGRIVISIMQDGEFHSPEDGKGRKMAHGTAILMPAQTPHNFASTGERIGDVANSTSVDDILDGKIPGTVFLSFHVGYVDVESEKALRYIA